MLPAVFAGPAVTYVGEMSRIEDGLRLREVTTNERPGFEKHSGVAIASFSFQSLACAYGISVSLVGCSVLQDPSFRFGLQTRQTPNTGAANS